MWGSVCGCFIWSPIRVEIFLFFCPRGSRSGNGRTETFKDALHAIGASVLKPYVGDVEGKDTCAQQHRADGGARGVVASVLVSVRAMRG